MDGVRRARTSSALLVAALALTVVVLPWAVPGKAGAATQIGRADAQSGSGAAGGTTWVQSHTAPTSPSYAVPAGGGVVVAWSVEAFVLDETLKLKVFRPTPDSATFRVVGESGFWDLPGPGLQQFPARIPVAAGDRIGLTVVNGPDIVDFHGNALPTGNPADIYRNAVGDPPVGSMFVTTGIHQNATLNVAARIEPDADGDWFGDETQDQCPTDASTQGPCGGGGDDANDFSFGKVNKNKKKGTAKLTVEVPAPGELDLAKTKKVKADEGAITPGGAFVSIKPRGKVKKKLNNEGKAKVKAILTYTRTGGSPNTKDKKIKLVKR